MTQLLSNKQLLEGLLDESTIKKELVTELFGIGDSPVKKLLGKIERMHKELAAMTIDLEQERIEADSIKVAYKAMDALEKLLPCEVQPIYLRLVLILTAMAMIMYEGIRISLEAATF